MSEIGVVEPLRSAEMSGAGLQSHDASLTLCVPAMWSPSVVSESEGAMSCRFEDQGMVPLSVRPVRDA